MMGASYRPPIQDEEVDESALEVPGEGPRMTSPCSCWGTSAYHISAGNRTDKKQSQRFLECVEDNFLTQLVNDPVRNGSLLDLLLVNREVLLGDVKVGEYLG